MHHSPFIYAFLICVTNTVFDLSYMILFSFLCILLYLCIVHSKAQDVPRVVLLDELREPIESEG